jgi:hypothetical protein
MTAPLPAVRPTPQRFKRHMCVNIEGFMRNNRFPSGYRGVFTDDDGRPMPPDEARRMLLVELAKGHKLLAAGACEGFDPVTGCPGHPDSPAIERVTAAMGVAG